MSEALTGLDDLHGLLNRTSLICYPRSPTTSRLSMCTFTNSSHARVLGMSGFSYLDDVFGEGRTTLGYIYPYLSSRYGGTGILPCTDDGFRRRCIRSFTVAHILRGVGTEGLRKPRYAIRYFENAWMRCDRDNTLHGQIERC